MKGSQEGTSEMENTVTAQWHDADRSAQEMLRPHPFVLGGIQPCDLYLPGRGEHAVICRTHNHGFGPSDHEKYSLSIFPDICPVARLEVWKAKRFIAARTWGPDKWAVGRIA